MQMQFHHANRHPPEQQCARIRYSLLDFIRQATSTRVGEKPSASALFVGITLLAVFLGERRVVWRCLNLSRWRGALPMCDNLGIKYIAMRWEVTVTAANSKRSDLGQDCVSLVNWWRSESCTCLFYVIAKRDSQTRYYIKNRDQNV